jgi:hypothetical protein
MLDVVLGIPEPAEVLAAKRVAQAKEGLMGNAQEDVPSGDASDLAEGPRRLRQVLEHFEAEHEVVHVAIEGQVIDVRAEKGHGRAPVPGPGERFCIQLDRFEPHAGDPSGQMIEHDSLAAPYLQDTTRPRLGDRGRHPGQEASDEMADDGIARVVLGLVVAANGRSRQPSRPRIETSSALFVW